MDQGMQLDATRSLIKVSGLTGALAIVAAVLVGAGWIFDIAALRTLFTPFAQMSANGALAFLLAGASVGLVGDGGTTRRRVSQACAGSVMLIGALMLSQHAFGWDLGIDQLLFRDPNPESPYPGRMSVLGSANFLMLGAALALIDFQTPSGRWPAQWLVLPVICSSFVVILGFTYDAASLYNVLPGGRPAALQAMIILLLLAVGVLLARPDRGLIAQLRAADAGGFLMRRLLPAAVLVPPIVGWLCLQGEAAGLYEANVGVALHATANVAIFSLLIWHTAMAVGRADTQRQAAEAKANRQLARLDLLNHITRAIGERQDVHSVFQVVVRTLEDHLPIDFGCIGLYDPATQIIRIESIGARSEALAMQIALPQYALVPIDRNGLARCVRGALVYEPDISQSTFAFPQQLAGAGLKSLVIAPLRAESSVFGVLIAARHEAHGFSSDDCEFLRQLSEHVALATRQSQLYSALQSAYDDLRLSQETVLQQERLRALGQMASGIAHDINNALSPASLYTESLLERESGLSLQGREQLTTIQRALDDVTETVSRMREFYRQREPQLRLAPVDLNQLVRQVADLTRARWRDLPQERGIVIEMQTGLDAALPVITGAEGEIRDALTNLIFNAVDAMPRGGALTVQTRALTGGATNRTSSHDNHVCVEISDTGTGMDEDTRRRCLEPFFTTKGERGTGLGLAMVYGMVQRHNAELEIDSTPGAGTTVRLIFPIAVAAEATADATELLAPTRRLSILVVDDDPLLIKSLRDTLQADGHVITTADGGEAGMNTFLAAQKRGALFDVVITDLGMPYVDGRKVASCVSSAAPGTPVILLTGWGQRLLSENEIPANVDRVLAKPPKLRELRATLAQLTTREPSQPSA